MLRLLPILLLLCQATLADERQPAWLLQLPETTRFVLVADTGNSKLHRYSIGPDGVRLLDEHYMSIGENGVGKERAWDGRTPLGVYFVTDELDTTTLHPKYGVTAFPLDYPNEWDRRHGRTGDGIWLHGVDPLSGERPARDTDGCLALANDRLTMIAGDMMPLATPVIIVRQMKWRDPGELRETAAALESAVRAWSRNFAASDLHSYFRLYADDFSYRGMSRDDWMAYRVETTADRVLDDFLIEELVLLADPEEDDLYVSRFRQTLVQGDKRLTTMKRLYWRRLQSGTFEIVAEDNG